MNRKSDPSIFVWMLVPAIISLSASASAQTSDCFRQTGTAGESTSYEVFSEEEVCDNVAHSDTVEISVVRKRDKLHEIAFVFESEGPQPELYWSSSTSLTISIKVVASVLERVDDVAGLKIRYVIGKIVVPRVPP